MTRPNVAIVKLIRVTYLTGTGAFYDLSGALVFEIDAWTGPTTTAREYSWSRPHAADIGKEPDDLTRAAAGSEP